MFHASMTCYISIWNRALKKDCDIMLRLCLAIVLFSGCHATCSGDTSNVVTMCKNSVKTGTMLRLDTSLASTLVLTDGTSTMIGCTCFVETRIGKKLSVWSNFYGVPGSECGTSVKIGANIGQSGATPCYSAPINLNVGTHNNVSVDMELKRIRTPYDANYCVSFTLNYCSVTRYQCKNGACIQKDQVCDAIPDCGEDEDEQNCAGSCSEGLILCDDQRTCISPSMRCDNQTINCPDGSDEAPKYCDPNYVPGTSGGNGAALMPQMTITCLESDYLPATTTSTSTTTSTTTTTTTHTTTSSTTSPLPTTTTTSTTPSTIPSTSSTTSTTTSTTSTTPTTTRTTTTPRKTTSTASTTTIPTTTTPTTPTSPTSPISSPPSPSTSIPSTTTTTTATIPTTTTTKTSSAAQTTQSTKPTVLTTLTTKEETTKEETPINKTTPEPTTKEQTSSSISSTSKTSTTTTIATSTSRVPPVTTQQQVVTTEADDDDKVLIVAIVSGVAGLILLIVCIVCWIRTAHWNRRKKPKMKRFTADGGEPPTHAWYPAVQNNAYTVETVLKAEDLKINDVYIADPESAPRFEPIYSYPMKKTKKNEFILSSL